MQYAIQVTQRFDREYRGPEKGERPNTTLVNSIIPCVSFSDAEDMLEDMKSIEQRGEIGVQSSRHRETMRRSVRIVAGIYNADNQKRMWISLEDLSQIVTEFQYDTLGKPTEIGTRIAKPSEKI